VIIVGGEALVDLVDDSGSHRAVAGGGPFNTAVALGRLEVPVAFLGAIAHDAYGEILLQLLIDAGVDTSLVRRSDLPTPSARVRREDDGRNSFTFSVAATAFTDITPDELPVLPDDAWAIHVGTLALALDPPAAAYEALLEREAGRRRIVLDPNVRPAIFGDAAAYRGRFEHLARVADVVKLSDDDAAWIYPGVPLEDVLERILAFGPRLVAVTRGERGALARSPLAAVDVPAIPVTVVDTVGAGDSFGAALLAALVDERALGPSAARELDRDVLERAVRYAVAASAVTCTRTGAVPPTRAEIDATLRSVVDGAPRVAVSAPQGRVSTNPTSST
jgi:fructokinase